MENINTVSILMEEALNQLKNFKWPGNVRQLKLYTEKLFSKCKYKKQVDNRLSNDR